MNSFKYIFNGTIKNLIFICNSQMSFIDFKVVFSHITVIYVELRGLLMK